MKRRYILVCSVMSILSILSCTKSKKKCICEYEYYINKIEKEHSGYNEKKWARINKKLDILQNNIKRYENKLTAEDKKRIKTAFNIYAKYRKDISLPFTERDVVANGNGGNEEKDQTVEKTHSSSTDKDRLEELKKITEQQQEIFLQLQQLRQTIEAESSTNNASKKQQTEKERLINKLQNDLLKDVLEKKKEGKIDIHGKIKILVFPTNYKGNAFNIDIDDLEYKVEKAINIIKKEAMKYGENIYIDYEIKSDCIYLNDSSEALDRYENYRYLYEGYNLISAVYVLDVVGRSYCSYRGILGNTSANAVMWHKREELEEHSVGTLVHELFHTLGADDLYYEEGVVPEEVEDNFHKLLGNSIMINSMETNELDPINAWLIGWNDQPELWYAWFVDRRNNKDIDW